MENSIDVLKKQFEDVTEEEALIFPEIAVGHNTISAMHTFASQVAIGFAKWLRENYCPKEQGYWIRKKGIAQPREEKQLFSIFVRINKLHINGE